MFSEDSDIRRLIKTSGICILFIVVELVGGYFANSVAIMSDAAHLLSDLISFGLSISALIISKRSKDKEFTFGYHRAEILGAMTSTIIIWVLTLFLLQEAYNRFINPHEIDANIMLITASIGLFFNFIMIYILHLTPDGNVACGDCPCSKAQQQKSILQENHSHSKKDKKLPDLKNNKIEFYNETSNYNGIKSNSSSGEEMLDSTNMCLDKPENDIE